MGAKKKKPSTGKKSVAASKRGQAPKRTTAKKAAAKKAPARKAAKSRHPVVHWEIQSLRPADLHRFYADTFGWAIDTNNMGGYGMVASGGKDGIDGGIGDTQASRSRVLVYASVPDIDEVLGRIADNGGKTVMPRQDVGPVVMALYEDPEGNLMGLVED